MALIASIKCGKSYQREHFHPFLDRPEPAGDSINPRAEYERIKRREARQGKR